MTRKAKIEDIAQVLAIYNANIDAGTASFEEEPFTYEEGMEWFLEHQGSIALHEKKGFRYMGELTNVAQKYGHRLGLVFYQRNVE